MIRDIPEDQDDKPIAGTELKGDSMEKKLRERHMRKRMPIQAHVPQRRMVTQNIHIC